MKGGWLHAIRQQYRAHDTASTKMVAKATLDADKYLTKRPVSVMDKAFTSASGSKHDYMSQAPYFWHDSSRPGGRPYMRRDGHRNPEINRITDKTYLTETESATRALALAWYYTGDEKYAQKASRLLEVWFIDTATRMHPNLNFAQAIPGVNDGRGIGIIETIALIGIADAVELLKGSTAWTDANDRVVKNWYAGYLDWMLTSKNGKEEYAAKNNHGTWFYAQAVAFALFTRQQEKAARLATESRQLLEGQIAADGSMPLELERTNALSYSTYNLQAWYRLAAMAEKAGVDLWHYHNSRKAGLQTATQWLFDYAMGKKKFPYQQIDRYNNNVYREMLTEASVVFNDASLVPPPGAPRTIEPATDH